MQGTILALVVVMAFRLDDWLGVCSGVVRQQDICCERQDASDDELNLYLSSTV